MAKQLTVTGFRQLMLTMRTLPKEAKKIIRRTQRQDAKQLASGIRSRAGSINRESGVLATTAAKVKSGRRSRGKLSTVVVFGDGWPSRFPFYPAQIELGYMTADNTLVPAQPFIRPEIDAMRLQHTRSMWRELKTGLIDNPPKS